MKMIALATTSIGLALATTPAMAGAPEQPTATVSTAGLDLATPEGQRLLDERIEIAARRVCEIDQSTTGSRVRAAEGRACLVQARASARRQVTIAVEGQQSGG